MSEWIKQKDAVLWKSEAKNSRDKINELTESNRQLREELEKIKTNSIYADYAARHAKDQQHITTLTTALAAAKEALKISFESRADWMSLVAFEDYTKKRNNALARIAECEKE